MANPETLIPGGYRLSKEEMSRGGKASGVARRRKKSLKQAIDLALSLPVSNPEIKAEMAAMGIDMDDADNQMAVVVGLLQKAMYGDHKAAGLLFEHMDEVNASAEEQAESHNALIAAIRKRNNED